MELGQGLLGTRLVFPEAVGRESEGADRLPGRGGLQFRVAGDIADEDDFVHGFHERGRKEICLYGYG